MANHTLYTAVNYYFNRLRQSAEKDLHYQSVAHNLDPEIVPAIRVRQAELLLTLITEMIRQIPEGFDDVTLPDDWMSRVEMRKRYRNADKYKRHRTKKALERIRRDAETKSGQAHSDGTQRAA